MSSTYWPRPRIKLGSSRRLIFAPTNLLTGISLPNFWLWVFDFRLSPKFTPSLLLLFGPLSLLQTGPRPRYARSPCSGRDCRREHGVSPPLSVSDFVSAVDVRTESSLACKSRTE